MTLELEDVDLVEVVRAVSARLERAPGREREGRASRSELHLELPVHCRGFWDRERVEQIVTQLLSNAHRCAAGKPIEVSIAADDEEVELSVRDYGAGIAAADQPRIFQRFERAGSEPSSSSIGLWTVQESALALGGHVRLSSEPGQGSCFVVTLPRVTEADLT
jgi:two-component system, OmpR family, sensor kinase